MKINENIVGKKIIIGKTVIDSKYYKKGEIHKVLAYYPKDEERELYTDAVVLENGNVLIESEIEKIL